MRKLTTGNTAGNPTPISNGNVGGSGGKLEIEHVDPRSLKHHPTNTRNHNQQNIDAIKASYAKFGQRKPLVVWRGLVIAGNGALEAVLSLGWKSVAITRCDHLTDTEARTYSIADNKTTDLSTFNYGKLAVELQELQSKEVDISTTGFQNFEVEPLISANMQVPEIPDHEGTGVETCSTVVPGMVYIPIIIPKEEADEIWNWLETSFGTKAGKAGIGLERGRAILKYIRS